MHGKVVHDPALYCCIRLSVCLQCLFASSELIHYGMELVNSKRTVLDLTGQLYAAVTFHEMYRLAAEDGLDPALGRKRRAAAGKALAKRNRQIKAKENLF